MLALWSNVESQDEARIQTSAQGRMMDKPTIGSKLDAMRTDLASIVDKMNRDRSHDLALQAQAALNAVASLQDEMSEWEETEWDWQPEPA